MGGWVVSSIGRAADFERSASRETAGWSAAVCWNPLRARGYRTVTIPGIGQSAGNPDVRRALRGHTPPALTSSRGRRDGPARNAAHAVAGESRCGIVNPLVLGSSPRRPTEGQA
jgi:hypothetical protein